VQGKSAPSREGWAGLRVRDCAEGLKTLSLGFVELGQLSLGNFSPMLSRGVLGLVWSGWGCHFLWAVSQ
jgi:hypothetical protein